MIRPPCLRRSLTAALLVAFTATCVGAARAQDIAQDDPHAGCAMAPTYVPPDLLERPLPLRDGVGNSHEEVTAASPEAQAYYDQGLNYLESYVWIEAARSFHQALRLDPKLAMAHLGLSYVYSGLDNHDVAKKSFEKAKELLAGVSDRERRRIEIREKHLVALADIQDTTAFLVYKKAIDDALAADLENPVLWVLRGNAEEPNASGRGQRGTASSVAFYEQVLRLIPDHATAHHYLVHSYETVGRIDKALEHGEVYARFAPIIPHAAHMWAHDLRRVGRIDEAIVQFLKTDSLESAYYEAEKMDPSLDWHHGHNLDLLATSYQHKGQMRLAEKVLREAADLKVLDVYRAYHQRALPGFLLHRARHEEALEAARSMTGSEYAQAQAVGHALAGQALVGLGRLDAAREELDAAQRALEMVPVITPGIVPRRSMVEPWVSSLRGDILMRTGKQDEGRVLLKNVQRALRAVPGPDAWTQTLFRLESIARSAIEVGDWDLAEHTALQMLDHDAAYGGSQLAMAHVLRHKGDAAGVERELDAAKGFWRDADSDLAELSEITTVKAAMR